MKQRTSLVAVLPLLAGVGLGLALVVSLFAILAQVYLEQPSEAVIAIANDTNESIVEGEVEAVGTAYPFSSIALGQRVSVRFPITREGGYRIRARFESGRTVDSGAERYVVPGFGIDDRADIMNDRISIRSITPFRVKLLRKDGSETFTPQVANEPLPSRREVIDVEVEGRTIRAMAHFVTWPGSISPGSGAPTAVVVAVELN